MKKAKVIKSLVVSFIFTLIIASIGPSFANAATFKKENQSIAALELDSAKHSDTIEYLENVDFKIIQDNKNVRVIESTENGKTSIAILNKNKNVLTLQIKGDDSTKVEIDMNEIAETVNSFDNSEDLATYAASTLEENTFTNYEYTITFSSPEKWQLRRPNPDNMLKYYYKDRTKTTTNSTKLTNFKKEVDNLNYYEWMFIGASSASMIVTVAAVIAAAITSGAGLAVALAALPISGAAYNYALKMGTAANNAHYWYFQV